jgi:hypothetical protein
LRIIMRILPPGCRCLRSFVTSDGMGGAVPSGDEPGGRERTIGELLDLLTGTGTDRGA